MRIILFITSLILSAASHAEGPTDIHGFNDAGEEIHIYMDGEIPVPPPEGFDRSEYPDASFFKAVYTIEVVKRGEKWFETKEKYSKQDCGFDDKFISYPGFSCSSVGKSPLAGSKYVYVKRLTECRGTLLTCKTGCGPRTPQKLVVDPWECE